MDNIRVFKLIVDAPFLVKGTLFSFHDITGNVYLIDNDKESEYPLRNGLGLYLWLLCTDKKCMEFIEEYED